jgi:hypothetical protein
MPHTTSRHGTTSRYVKGCRCPECTQAITEYQRRRRQSTDRADIDRHGLSDLLNELFPHGLTDDCPAANRRST